MSVDCGGYAYESIYAVCLVSVMCDPPDLPVYSLLEAMHYVCRPKDDKFDINKKQLRKFCLFNPNVEFIKIVNIRDKEIITFLFLLFIKRPSKCTFKTFLSE